MAAKLGLITIGQAPRTDIIPIYRRILGPEVELVETGALDGLTKTQVAELAPESADDLLVSRMADGSEVHLSQKALIPKIQACIDRLEAQSVVLTVLLCTGRFPSFRCAKVLIEPQRVIDGFIAALAQKEENPIGVMVPSAKQAPWMRHNLELLGVKPVITACSPYMEEGKLFQAAQEFTDENIKFIVMHCVGYTLEMKEVVRRATGKPVVLANSLVARGVKELLV